MCNNKQVRKNNDKKKNKKTPTQLFRRLGKI